MYMYTRILYYSCITKTYFYICSRRYIIIIMYKFLKMSPPNFFFKINVLKKTKLHVCLVYKIIHVKS